MPGADAIRARWAVAAMFAANGFVMGAWVPQIPLLLPRFAITETTLGLVILGFGLGAVGAMLFTGRLIATFGNRRVLGVAALALLPALPLVVHAPSLGSLVVAAVLYGAIIGSMDAAMNAHAVLVERKLHRAIMSASHGFWSLGGFVGSALGSLAIAHWGHGPQALTAAGVAAVLVLAALPNLLPDEAADPTLPPANKAILPRDARLWLLGVLALMSMVPEGAVMDWVAIYLGKDLGADLSRAGLGFACFAASMAVMRFSGDRLRDRFGAVRTLRLSGLVGALGLMGAAVATNDGVAIACFALSGLGMANMVPVMLSAAGNHPGIAPGQAIATVTMVGYAGILMAPAAIGYFAEHLGFRPTFAALSLLLLVVAALAGRASAADRVKAGPPPDPK